MRRIDAVRRAMPAGNMENSAHDKNKYCRHNKAKQGRKRKLVTAYREYSQGVGFTQSCQPFHADNKTVRDNRHNKAKTDTAQHPAAGNFQQGCESRNFT